MSSSQNKRGFALPMALLVMVVLTAGLAAGFSVTSAEVITNSAHRGDTRAYNLAQAGLETFLATRKDTTCTALRSGGSSTGGVVITTSCLLDGAAATADSEWVRISLTGGYADIKAVVVRKFISDTLPALFFIRSTGVDTSIKMTGATRAVNGERAVGMYATWTTNMVDVKGAWFALGGLDKNGNAGRIDGTDECGAKDAVAGAMVPNGGLFTGNTAPFQGTPPLDTSKTFDQVKASVKLDWAGIVGGSITADIEIPPNSFPSSSWFNSNPDAWPIIRIHTNNYSLPNQGRGMIIADSNFTISGSNMWDGIVLIGGSLTSNGNNTTAGATLSGLNYLLGGTPTRSSDVSDANGQKTYVYNSCHVDKASKGLRSYKPMSNSWIDAVPVW